MLHLAGPKWEPTAAYYDCRFAVLRQPLGFERGAEVLNDDTEAIHAYIEIDQEIVAVGRSHLISASSNGSQSDFPGQSGPKTPPFSALDANNRPAIQIRQMGTLEAHRRKRPRSCSPRSTRESISSTIWRSMRFFTST